MKILSTISLGLILVSLHFTGQCQKFNEVSNECGIDYNYPGNDYQEVGAGVTVIDVNNDGWDDVFQSGGVFPSKLWINKKGKFIDGTAEYNLDTMKHHFIQSVVAGDYDNDGFEDLFICNMGKLMSLGDSYPPVLLHNINGKRFEPVFQAIFTDLGSFPGASWGDLNNDGFIDLYLLNYVSSMYNGYDSILDERTYIPICGKNFVFLNNGGKGFTEVSDLLGLNNSGCGLAVSFTDFDNDNDMDIILLNDFGEWNHIGNYLYRNNYPANTYTDISESMGFYEEFYGMGVGIGDVDNNGWLDYYLTNIGRNYLYENQAGQLVERGIERSIDESLSQGDLKGTSWSGLFFDIENDGDLDLYVAKGYLNSVEKVVVKDPNKLFLNNGFGEFTDISSTSGCDDSLAHRGAATFDFDHDGDLDIISSVIKMQQGELGYLDQKIKLFENLSDSENNWLGIKLIGQDHVNRSAVGCSVSFTIDGKTYIREVDGGSGHGSQSTRILYFGLGDTKAVAKIEVQWVGGSTTTIKKLKAGRVYSVYQNGIIKKVY